MDRPDKDLNRAFYDTEREDDRRRFEEEPSKVFLVETLVPWVVGQLEPGARLIDIAGGSGVYASRIVRAAPVTVVGVDISESMVRQRGEDPMLPENVVGDMEQLPFEDGSFDAALFVACLHHVPDPLPALREAHRVLRDGGKLFAAEPCSLRVGRAGVAPVPGHPQEFRFSMSYLTQRVEAASFRVDGILGKRLTLRFAKPLWPTPGLGAYHVADRADRVLARIPGATRLAALALVQATRLPLASSRSLV
jgi:SAM-dependent methyltransferase